MWTVAVLGAGPTLFGGVVAYLAGAFGLRELRRLRRVGVSAWALVKCRPARPDDLAGAVRPLLQFATKDGLVMEVFSPVCSSRSQPLVDGGRVLIAYDPVDPRQIIVRGRERVGLEYAFLALGAVAVLTGLTLLTVNG